MALYNTGQVGLAQLGLDQLGQYETLSSNVTGTFLGQGILTPELVVVVSTTFLGQGILLQNLSPSASFTGQGIFYQLFPYPLDSTVILYLSPRAIFTFTMPIAYIYQLTADEAGPSAPTGPSTATIPITGSQTALVEGNDGEPLANP
jgi:hypothetical protein